MRSGKSNLFKGRPLSPRAGAAISADLSAQPHALLADTLRAILLRNEWGGAGSVSRDEQLLTSRMFKNAVQRGRSEAHGVTNKRRHICARRRDGEPAVS